MAGRPNRVNLQLPPDLKKWYDETADQLGLTTTAFMIMALQQVREGTEQAKQHFLEQNPNIMSKNVKPANRSPEETEQAVNAIMHKTIDHALNQNPSL